MSPLKKSLSYLVIGGVSFAGVTVANSLFKDVQFARAEEQVQASREQLQKMEDFAGVYRTVGKAVEPSVVSIEVHKKIKTASAQGHPEIPEDMKRFFPDRDGDGEPDIPGFGNQPDMEQIGTGSGVIMQVDGSYGYILTNNHVAGDAEEMTVTLSDGREIKKAKLLGADPKSDLAVVRIEADRLIAAKWGDSDQLEKGDLIMAFGSPFGYVGSMTHGIVSALNRQAGILGRNGYENFVQVDAPINPGNSGGPLVNLKGEVVGINTAIASRTGSFNGIGFAIPSNQAKQVYGQLKDKGKVVRGYIGVSIMDVSRDPNLAKSFGYDGDKGVLVQETYADTPASGILSEGDIVTSINGKKVDNSTQLRNIVAGLAPNEDTTFAIVREGKPQEVKIKIGEQPDDLTAMRSKGKKPSLSKNDSGEKGDANANVLGELGLKLVNPTPAMLQRWGLDNDALGAVVSGIDARGLAGKAGFVQGDLITKIGTEEVVDADSAKEAIAKQDLSKGIRFYVVNREGSRFVFVKSEGK
jgi:serine protease Do